MGEWGQLLREQDSAGASGDQVKVLGLGGGIGFVGASGWLVYYLKG